MKKFEFAHYDQKAGSLEDFKKQYDIQWVIDEYEENLNELFLIRNPQYRFIQDRAEAIAAFTQEHTQGKLLQECGEWFYFQWSKTLAHYLPDEMHQEIRTARNKNLVTKEEQDKFYNTTVGVTGLSVGSHAALTIAMSGGSKKIKLADPDTISPSNLNRVRYGATKIGGNKAELAAQQITEMNPYSEVYLYTEGITIENIDEFLLGSENSPKIDILLEELDNLEMKIRLRIESRKHGIPVLMATDNGDGVIMDVERFDLEPHLPIFNNAIGDITVEDFMNFPPQEMPRLATKVAGPDFVVPRMLSSLFEVGKTLYSWPQLGTAATFSGVILSYAVRSISNGGNIKSGKYNLSIEAILNGSYSETKMDEERGEFLSKLGLK